MKFKTISYRRLESVEKFRNVTVEATVELEDGDDPETAFEELRVWVDYKALERRRKIEGVLSDDGDAEEDRVAAGPIHFQSGSIPPAAIILNSAPTHSNPMPAGQPPRFTKAAQQAQAIANGISAQTIRAITGDGQIATAPSPAPPSMRAAQINAAMLPAIPEEVHKAFAQLAYFTDGSRGYSITAFPTVVGKLADGRSLTNPDRIKIEVRGGDDGATLYETYLPEWLATWAVRPRQEVPPGYWLQVTDGSAGKQLSWQGSAAHLSAISLPQGFLGFAQANNLIRAAQGKPGLIFGPGGAELLMAYANRWESGLEQARARNGSVVVTGYEQEECDGSDREEEEEPQQVECPECGGTGDNPDEDGFCFTCDGDGWVTVP